MSYFDHPYLSNSDLKRLKQQLGMLREPPENLQAIFSFGTRFHMGITEPHLLTIEDKASEEYPLIMRMKDTFWKDELCRNFIMSKDFHREHEFYDILEVDGMQMKAKCKADGYRSKMKFFLEMKSTACESQKAFEQAMLDLDYDQACAHYMLTSKCDLALIVGISKRKPERLFKRIVKKYDDWYLGGEQKLIDTMKLVQVYSPSDIVMI